MKVLLNWIKDFVDIDESIESTEIANKLTLHTCEVEGVESNLEGYDGIVIGQIKEVLSHPNADKLKVTKTDIGGEITQIVCGGTNIYEGMYCVVATLGAKVLWHGTDEMIMEKVKLRGEESSGMICSADEVGLKSIFSHAEGEVVDLKNIKNIKAGDSVRKLLGEESIVLDIDNKSLTHRPDLWGHYGLAREVAAIYEKDFSDIKMKDISGGNEKIKVSVIAKDRCPRFEIVKLSGLKVEPSPAWMQTRLEECGVRPISNIVDVTNYVMIELGQPMHAYDSKKIKGGFTIRLSEDKEVFKTLDDIERKLTGDEVLVCDDEKILGLGGVMGGLSTEVSDSTTEIYLESANWTKTPIRKTSTRLGLRTEAVARYEKGLDPLLTEMAMKRAINLLQEMCSTLKIDSEIVDIRNFEVNDNEIELSLERVNMMIGQEISEDKIEDYLVRLGFSVNKKSKSIWKVMIPSFRSTGDINIEEDLIEEVVRMFGYENIDEKALSIVSSYGTNTKMNRLQRRIRTFLKSVNLWEVMTYTFVADKLMKKVSGSVDNLLEVLKPLSSDLTHLRDSLVPRLLEVLERNNKPAYKIFEIGHVHFKDKKGRDNLPLEEVYLSGVLVRKSNKKKRDIFFEAKGVLENLFSEIGLLDIEYKENKTDKISDNICSLEKKGKILGTIKTLNKQTSSAFGQDGKDVAVFEISLTKVMNLCKDIIEYKPIPKFPAISNGMTLIAPEEVTIQQMLDTISNLNHPLVEEVSVGDIYRGEQIGEGKKSVVIDVVYRSADKTLTEEEASKVHKEILNRLKSLGVSHR